MPRPPHERDEHTRPDTQAWSTGAHCKCVAFLLRRFKSCSGHMTTTTDEEAKRRFVYHLLLDPVSLSDDDPLWRQLPDRFFKSAIGLINDMILHVWFNNQRPDSAAIEACFRIITVTAAAQGATMKFDRELFTGMVEGTFGDTSILDANEHRNQDLFNLAITVPSLLMTHIPNNSGALA